VCVRQMFIPPPHHGVLEVETWADFEDARRRMKEKSQKVQNAKTDDLFAQMLAAAKDEGLNEHQFERTQRSTDRSTDKLTDRLTDVVTISQSGVSNGRMSEGVVAT